MIAVYRNAVVFRVGLPKLQYVHAVIRDAAALRACHELAAGKDLKGAEKAVGDAIWEGKVPGSLSMGISGWLHSKLNLHHGHNIVFQS